MHRKKVIIVVTGTLTVLAVVLALAVPRLIDTEAIRGAIAKEASKRIAGKVFVPRITLSFLPLPLATLHDVSVSIPDTLTGTVESLSLEPRMGPLLTGTLRIGSISILRPNIRFFAQGKADTPARAPTEDEVRAILSELASVFPDGSVRVVNGALELKLPGHPPTQFSDIDAGVRFHRDSIAVTLACRCAFAENVSLSGTVGTRDLTGDWRGHARGIRPHILAEHLYPAAAEHVGDSSVSINVRLRNKGFRVFDAEFDGSAPSLTLLRRTGQHVFVVDRLAGLIHHSGENTELSITDLALASPSLVLSSKLTVDRQTPHAALEIEGRDIDVAALRKSALALAGDLPLVETIFSYVRAGTIPLITFSTDGRTAADLGATRNIHVEGQMRDGTVGIPGPRLVVEHVEGDVIISKGILRGSRLRGKIGKAMANDGRLSVGLKGEDAPFQLDIHVDSHFGELLPHLKRLIRNPSVVQELSRVRTIEGTAQGRLVLGDSLQSILVRTDITSMRFSASYDRIPYPVEVREGKFLYNERTEAISVADLSGSIGRSTFSGFTSDLDMKQDLRLTVRSMKSSLLLDELYPWLTSYESAHQVLGTLTGLKGSIDVTALTFDGPLPQIGTWRFQGSGEMRGVRAEAKDLPGPLKVKQGDYTLSHEKLSITNLQANILDASLKVSGYLKGYLHGPPEVEATLTGGLGTEATRYVSDMISPRPEIGLRGPLSLSDVTLRWNGAGRSSVTGRLGFEAGPVVALNVVREYGRVSVPALEITDGDRQGSLSFQPGEREFHLRLTGDFHESTVGKILTGLGSPACCVRGNLDAHIRLDQPSLSRAQGTVEVMNLRAPSLSEGPLTVQSLSLTAAGNVLTVNDASLSWPDGGAVLHGNATLSETSILLDMDLTAGKLQVERVTELVKSFQTDKKTPATRSPVIEGTIRVKADSLAYRDLTWHPFDATMSFGGERLEAAITEARLCGIAMPGSITITGDVIEVSTSMAASGENTRSTVQCLTDKKVDLTGTYSLNAGVHARGTAGSLYRSLSGNVEFKAREGLIFRSPALANIFALLNVSEIFRGKFPDFGEKGLRYETVSARGEIKEGRVLLEEVVVDGPTVRITGEGEIDLVEKSLNLTALVAPFKTIDSILGRIPIIGYVLGGGLVAVPVQVRGKFNDPKVAVMSPSAVSMGLLGVMKRTLGLPFNLTEALVPGSGAPEVPGDSSPKP